MEEKRSYIGVELLQASQDERFSSVELMLNYQFIVVQVHGYCLRTGGSI